MRAVASAWRMQHELPPASQRLGVQTVEISFKSAAAAAAVGAARHAPRHRRDQTACNPIAMFVAWYDSARALRPELHAARRHATAGEACPTGDKTVSKSNCLKVESRGSNKNGSLKKSAGSGVAEPRHLQNRDTCRTVTLVSRERGKDYMAERSGQTKKLDDCRCVAQGAFARNDDQQCGG